MITNLDEIKRCLSSGFTLRNRGDGWKFEARSMSLMQAWQMADTLEVPADLVALLAAQGHIVTEQRLVGVARLAA